VSDGLSTGNEMQRDTAMRQIRERWQKGETRGRGATWTGRPLGASGGEPCSEISKVERSIRRIRCGSASRGSTKMSVNVSERMHSLYTAMAHVKVNQGQTPSRPRTEEPVLRRCNVALLPQSYLLPFPLPSCCRWWRRSQLKPCRSIKRQSQVIQALKRMQGNKSLGISVRHNARGLEVTRVQRFSPAHDGGVKTGDVLVAFSFGDHPDGEVLDAATVVQTNLLIGSGDIVWAKTSDGRLLKIDVRDASAPSCNQHVSDTFVSVEPSPSKASVVAHTTDTYITEVDDMLPRMLATKVDLLAPSHSPPQHRRSFSRLLARVVPPPPRAMSTPPSCGGNTFGPRQQQSPDRNVMRVPSYDPLHKLKTPSPTSTERRPLPGPADYSPSPTKLAARFSFPHTTHVSSPPQVRTEVPPPPPVI
jgi:hypothetical protein